MFGFWTVAPPKPPIYAFLTLTDQFFIILYNVLYVLGLKLYVYLSGQIIKLTRCVTCVALSLLLCSVCVVRTLYEDARSLEHVYVLRMRRYATSQFHMVMVASSHGQMF